MCRGRKTFDATAQIRLFWKLKLAGCATFLAIAKAGFGLPSAAIQRFPRARSLAARSYNCGYL